jgi:hypothetical protein
MDSIRKKMYAESSIRLTMNTKYLHNTINLIVCIRLIINDIKRNKSKINILIIVLLKL